MNFTLDDTSAKLTYSPGWGIQTSTDPNLSQFFEGTYHVAQVDGANVNMSISGSDVYIFGSKGPGHGNFSVQFDNAVIFLSAYSTQTQYQQLLFHHSFDPSASSSPHFVSLRAQLTSSGGGGGAGGMWFDFDFVTFTDNENGNSTAASTQVNTIPIPWGTTGTSVPSPSSSSSSVGTGATGAASVNTSQPSHTNKTSTIIAILFGTLIGLAIILFIVYLFLKRVYDSKRNQERSFRYGESMRGLGIGVGGTGGGGGGGGGPTRTQSRWNLLSGFGRPTTTTTSSSTNLNHHNTHQMTPPQSPAAHHTFSTSAIGVNNGVVGVVGSEREGTVQTESTIIGTTTTTTGTTTSQTHTNPSSTFAFLSNAPISYNTYLGGLGGRKGKGDADSLKTDFLQV
ncbi:hypothetical protein ABKN59_010330 [Abortiporus biennis]